MSEIDPEDGERGRGQGVELSNNVTDRWCPWENAGEHHDKTGRGEYESLRPKYAQEHHDKTASGEYKIPRLPNKPGGYSNLKVYAGLILLAYIVVDSIIWWIRGKLRAIRIQAFRQKLETHHTRQNVNQELEAHHTRENMKTEKARAHHGWKSQKVRGGLSQNDSKPPAVPAERNNTPKENNRFTGPYPSDTPSRYNEGGAALFTPAPAITTWGVKYKQKLDAQTRKDDLKLEKVWIQRRREAQEKLKNTSRHIPEALARTTTWDNKELVGKSNQRRKEVQKELEEKRIQEERETENYQALREGKTSVPLKVKVGYARAQQIMDQRWEGSWQGTIMRRHPKDSLQYGKSCNPFRKRHLYVRVSKEAGQQQKSP